MGWTGIPVDRKPDTAEMNRMIDDAMRSPTYKIIDRSGWYGWNHQFLLCERNEDADTENPTRRFVVVALAYHADREFRYKLSGEDEGPNEHDCPVRILDKLEEYPPRNASAAEWRRLCREHVSNATTVRNLFRRIDNVAQEGETAITLKGGHNVIYRMGKRRGKNVRAYREEGKSSLYQLHANMMDLEATDALITQAEQAAQQTAAQAAARAA